MPIAPTHTEKASDYKVINFFKGRSKIGVRATMEDFEVLTGAVAHIEKQYTELTSLSWEGQRTFTDTDFQIVITLAIHRDSNRATAIFTGSTQQKLFDTLLDAMENFGLEWDYTSYDDES